MKVFRDFFNNLSVIGKLGLAMVFLGIIGGLTFEHLPIEKMYAALLVIFFGIGGNLIVMYDSLEKSLTLCKVAGILFIFFSGANAVFTIFYSANSLKELGFNGSLYLWFWMLLTTFAPLVAGMKLLLNNHFQPIFENKYKNR